MADSDPIADLISLLATPVAGAVRSVEQFRSGVDEFLRGIDNFNRTMENLNETAERINRLLGEVEEPIRLAVPQVTRAVRNADEMMQVVSGPAMAVAPGLNRLADTLSNPAFQQLPDQLGQFTELLTEMSARMAPLTQFAESAGGLLGMRLPGTGRGAARPASSTPSSRAAADDADSAPEGRPSGATSAERATPSASTSSAKRSSKSSSAKKAPAAERKSAVRASSAKTSGSKSSSAAKKKTASKSSSAKKKTKTTSGDDD